MKSNLDVSPSNSKRVLVWGLTNNLAGTEGVIRNIVFACCDSIEFDFLTTEDVPNHRDLVECGNNRLFVLPKVTTFANEFRKGMADHFREHAHEYSAVWSNHCDGRNIEMLKLAFEYNIPRRIMHSHSSDLDGSCYAQLLSLARKKLIAPKLTDRWACSQKAGEYMFGNHQFEIIPNAIPFEKYTFNEKARVNKRQALGIPESAFVLGYVARFVKTKNHEFILRLLTSSQELSNAYFVMVGEGELKSYFEGLIQELSLQERVRIVPPTKELGSIYSCFDVFAFPSIYEGLPLVLLEAQANGLPVVMSDTISDEGVVSNSVTRVPLTERSLWIDALLKCDRDQFVLANKSEKYNLLSLKPFFIDCFTNKEN